MGPTHPPHRRAPPRLALLATAATCLACGGDATAPVRSADLVGTYGARTFVGHVLPWADTSATDTTRSQTIWYSLRLTLRADSTALDVATYQNRGDPRPRTDSTYERWVLNPPTTDGYTGAPVPSGADVLRLRYIITAPHDAPYADFYYRVEDGGRRLVTLGAGGTAGDVYARE